MNTFSNKIIQAKFDVRKNINLLNCMAESLIRKTQTHFLRTIKVILLDALIALYHEIISYANCCNFLLNGCREKLYYILIKFRFKRCTTQFKRVKSKVIVENGIWRMNMKIPFSPYRTVITIHDSPPYPKRRKHMWFV